ncbi:MAG: mechanosensitive ion channel family protein [Niameybacter sp.]|uniref:mechanosensitive ion channel family protein n=1 Tax=Niameybacter sp. TaxID=2033640 RepID=UPI002FCC9399
MKLFDLFSIPKPYHFYIQLALALIVTLGLLLLSKTLRKVIIKFFTHFNDKLPNFLDELNLAFAKPLDYWLRISSLYMGLILSPFVAYNHLNQVELYINESLQINLAIVPIKSLHMVYGLLCIALATWATYNSVNIYEDILMEIGSKFMLLDHQLLIRFTGKIIRLTIILIGIMMMITQLNIKIAGILTGVGLGGVAFTFIAKDTLTNIMSGVVLMIDRPFTIGDWVQCGSIEGIIEDVSFRSTRIRTFEQGLVIVPNTTLANDNILNWSTMPKRRVRFSLGVTYDTSSDKLQTFMDQLKESLAQNDLIEKDTSLVYFDDFGDFSLNIIVLFYALQTDLKSYSALKQQVNLDIMRLAAELEVNIAFPTQTIQIQNTND